jgi:hypothetical protein
MKKTLLTFISIIAFAFILPAQNVNIPDANFKAKLLADYNINNDANNKEISSSEASAFNGLMDVSTSNISSLTGIESFINIVGLYCYSNQLTTLDLSNNKALKDLSCFNNQLTTLDVTKNLGLISLNCYNNQLRTLDVTKNLGLISLGCAKNQLTTLDVTKNTVLKTLGCAKNQLMSIDITKNTALTSLGCQNNQLTTIDLRNNVQIEFLYCDTNQLITLDVTKNLKLDYLGCTSNSNLSCIQTLNSQIKTNWIKDNTATYSENCNYTTGLNDETISQPKTIQAIYNIQGQQVNTNTQGLVIIRFTDGTSEKVMQ